MSSTVRYIKYYKPIPLPSTKRENRKLISEQLIWISCVSQFLLCVFFIKKETSLRRKEHFKKRRIKTVKSLRYEFLVLVSLFKWCMKIRTKGESTRYGSKKCQVWYSWCTKCTAFCHWHKKDSQRGEELKRPGVVFMHSQSSSPSIWSGFRTMENNVCSVVIFFF